MKNMHMTWVHLPIWFLRMRYISGYGMDTGTQYVTKYGWYMGWILLTCYFDLCCCDKQVD